MRASWITQRVGASARVVARLFQPILLATVLVGVLPFLAHARELGTIGVLVGDLGNPFFEQISRGVEKSAARLIGPKVRVIVRSSGWDLDRQVSQIDAFINDHVDLLILNAVDTQKIGPAVDRARAAGLVVVAIDVSANGAQATVTSDNRNAGHLACEYIAKWLKGKGNVVIMNGPPTSSIIERVEGCQSVLSRYSNLTVLDDGEDCGGTVEGGLAHMTAILTRYPHIDAVFAINDLIGIGADIAAVWAHRSGFLIVSVDGSPPSVEALKDPTMDIAATVAQRPRQMAEKAVLLGRTLFDGRKAADSAVEIVPVELISRENVASYAGWAK